MQRSSQLRLSLSSLLSLSNTDPSPPGCGAAVGDLSRATVGDLSWDTERRPTGRATSRGTARCGLTTGFGAWTVMLGRELLPEGSVAAIAVPPGPDHGSPNNETARARVEKKPDASRIAISSNQGG